MILPPPSVCTTAVFEVVVQIRGTVYLQSTTNCCVGILTLLYTSCSASAGASAAPITYSGLGAYDCYRFPKPILSSTRTWNQGGIAEERVGPLGRLLSPTTPAVRHLLLLAEEGPTKHNALRWVL